MNIKLKKNTIYNTIKTMINYDNRCARMYRTLLKEFFKPSSTGNMLFFFRIIKVSVLPILICRVNPLSKSQRSLP